MHGMRWARSTMRRVAAVATGTVIAAGLVMISAPASATITRPCDIYDDDGAPCVAAHSMTRALYGEYDGALYQVERESDSTTLDVGLASAGGYADIAPQDAFCADTRCWISTIYDQSPEGNDLTLEPPGEASGGLSVMASAEALQVTVDGNRVYGLFVSPGVGYKDAVTTGVATDGDPESMYMVASGTYSNSMCCFNYGNSEVGPNAIAKGHMNALNLSSMNYFNQPGTGPWIQADFEFGVYPGDVYNPSNTGNSTPFVTAVLHTNGQDNWGLEGGDAQTGTLATLFDGDFPDTYGPLHQEGAIILGTGGDGTHVGVGMFFEGAMTAGEPSAAAYDAVQANIVAAEYETTEGTLVPGSAMSLRSTTDCCSDWFISAPDGEAEILPMSEQSHDQYMNGATYLVREGLADDSCISFESRHRPNEYLRHYGFELLLEENDATTQFAEDATFCVRPGNSGVDTSFESYNYPGRFIRHYNQKVYLASDGGPHPYDSATDWSDDSTFAVSAPWNAYTGGSLNDGAELTFQATGSCCSTAYIRHQNGYGALTTMTWQSTASDMADATFVAEKGLGNASCTSFQASNFPGYYLRHSNFRIVLSAYENTAQFKADATFCARHGRNGYGLSFMSLNMPDHYMRHYNGSVYMAYEGGPQAWDTATSWDDDTSFVINPAWVPN